MKKEQSEIIIRISDLCAAVLKAAKPILCLALVFALLGALFGVSRAQKAAGNPGGTAEAIVTAEKAVTDARERFSAAEMNQDKLMQVEIPAAEAMVSRGEHLVQSLQDYMNNSIYYRIDPFRCGISRATLYVDTDVTVDPASPWTTVDPQKSIVVAATCIYPFDSEIVENIRKLLGQDAEAQYINELISVSNVSDRFIEIQVCYEDADTALAVANYLRNVLQDRLAGAFSEYSCAVISSFSGYEINWAMNEKHNATEDSLLKAEAELADARAALQLLKADDSRALELDDAKAELDAAEAELRALEGQLEGASAGTKTLLKRAVRYGVIFLIIGLLLGCAYAAFVRIFGGTIQDISTVIYRYPFPLIGVLPSKKKRWFDQTIRKLEGEPVIAYEEAGNTAAQSILSSFSGKKVAYISSLGNEAIENILQFTKDQIPVCGDIIKDADAVMKASSFDSFILVEERGRSRIDMVNSEIRRINAMGKEADGIILL